MAVGTPSAAAVSPSTAAVVARAAARTRRFTPEYWAGLRFLAFGRAIPGTLFALMGWVQLSRVINAIHAMPPGAGAGRVADKVVSPLLYTAFCTIPAVLYLTRPKPKATDGSMGARTAAFTGTFMQLLVGTFMGAGPVLYGLPPFVAGISVAVSITSFSGALWSLAYLRRSLSIIPEARRLATGGPYQIVRHPLYLFEIMAALGALGAVPGLISAMSFVVFVGMQMVRAGYEERLLVRAFPEYADYARRTRRLIPFVW
ncbi:MAG TPA: isoprenylcysteine carboxylmethyltransferase family protein [Candidatus Dormibacteraeota bacterium]|nr:isoprenylcysteine carboxylmethyltransferase family protein [Candidatus Dormibacteraeota bacterium]